MTRFILRRLLILPVALLAINFVAFSYAHLAQRVQQLPGGPTLSHLEAGARAGRRHCWGSSGRWEVVRGQREHDVRD
jgi:hypothetical protein